MKEPKKKKWPWVLAAVVLFALSIRWAFELPGFALVAVALYCWNRFLKLWTARIFDWRREP